MASNVSLRALRNGYGINYAVKMVVNSKTEEILKSLTNLSLAKAYNYTIQPEHLACECYYCSLNYLIRKLLLDRGICVEYLSVGVTVLERFEETVPFYPYSEEYYELLEKYFFLF